MLVPAVTIAAVPSLAVFQLRMFIYAHRHPSRLDTSRNTDKGCRQTAGRHYDGLCRQRWKRRIRRHHKQFPSSFAVEIDCPNSYSGFAVECPPSGPTVGHSDPRRNSGSTVRARCCSLLAGHIWTQAEWDTLPKRSRWRHLPFRTAVAETHAAADAKYASSRGRRDSRRGRRGSADAKLGSSSAARGARQSFTTTFSGGEAGRKIDKRIRRDSSGRPEKKRVVKIAEFPSSARPATPTAKETMSNVQTNPTVVSEETPALGNTPHLTACRGSNHGPCGHHRSGSSSSRFSNDSIAASVHGGPHTSRCRSTSKGSKHRQAPFRSEIDSEPYF